MRILIVHNHYLHPGGEDEVVASEIKMLQEKGHEVIFYERTNHEIKALSFLGKIRFYLFEALWSKKTYKDISRIIKDSKPDIIHIHNTFLVLSPSVYQACHDSHVPVVQTLHNYRFLCPAGVFYRKNEVCEKCLEKGRGPSVINRCWKGSFLSSVLMCRIINKMYRKAIFQRMINRYIALSDFSRKKFMAEGFNPRTISVKPSFLENDPGVSPSTGDYALYIGALRDYKGIQKLVQSWLDERISYPLKIVGDGPLRDGLAKKSARAKNIQYLGFKDFNDVITLIKGARFLIVPSLCYETFGRVIVEAYACGVPVLVNRIGALQELVRESETGLLYDADNQKDLVHKVKFFVENNEIFEGMKVNARAEYEKKYTLDNNYQNLMSIYNEVLDKK